MAAICITGANRGIGLALAQQFAQRGDEVLAVCRRTSPQLDALEIKVFDDVDVTDDASVNHLVKKLGEHKIDVLINNAGILSNEALDDLDFDRMRQQFEINSLGPLRITAALSHNLGAGSKVAIVSSRMGSIDDNTSGGRYGYRMSKAAVNMAGRSLAHDLRGHGIAVAILHPGFVRTGMTGHQGLVDAQEAASGLIARIDDLTLETSGSFWHANGEVLPW